MLLAKLLGLMYPLTPLLILCPLICIAIVIGIISAARHPDFGGILIWPLSGLFLLVLLILGLDRLLTHFFSIKPIAIIEAIIICVVAIGFWLWNAYTYRELIIDCVSPKRDFFVLIENTGQLQDSVIRWRFPFHKKFRIKGNSCVINPAEINIRSIDFKLPDAWKQAPLFRLRYSQDKDLYFYGKRGTVYNPEIKEKLKEELKLHRSYR